MHGHGYGELTITSTNLEAALADTDHIRGAELDGAIAAMESSSAGGRPSGTVSIMVMYRPQKPKLPLGAAELPPSYDSLFTEENPPNYNRIITAVNLPHQDSHNSNQTNSSNAHIPLTNESNQQQQAGSLESEQNTNNEQDGASAISVATAWPNRTNIPMQSENTTDVLTSSTMADSYCLPTINTPVTDSTTRDSVGSSSVSCSNIGPKETVSQNVGNQGERVQQELLTNTQTHLLSAINTSQISLSGNEEHCQCDCDHTDCNNTTAAAV